MYQGDIGTNLFVILPSDTRKHGYLRDFDDDYVLDTCAEQLLKGKGWMILRPSAKENSTQRDPRIELDKVQNKVRRKFAVFKVVTDESQYIKRILSRMRDANEWGITKDTPFTINQATRVFEYNLDARKNPNMDAIACYYLLGPDLTKRFVEFMDVTDGLKGTMTQDARMVGARGGDIFVANAALPRTKFQLRSGFQKELYYVEYLAPRGEAPGIRENPVEVD